MIINTNFEILYNGYRGNLLYDDVNARYWNGTLYGGTYDDTMNFVAYLNSNFQSSEWGAWRLATASDIISLLTNSLVFITKSFTQTDDAGSVYYYQGRYNEVTDPGSHAELCITWQYRGPSAQQPYFKYVTTMRSVSDGTTTGGSAGRMGAWIVADAVKKSTGTHPSIPNNLRVSG